MTDKDNLQLLKCILVPLSETISSDLTIEEKYKKLEWYIKGMNTILFHKENILE